MNICLNKLNEKEKYHLLTSCIVPRPIAWVSTIDTQGVRNAAPFSYFTGVSIEPPLVMFVVERRDGKKKDTLINIEETKHFVINLVTSGNVEQMNITSKDFVNTEDEFDLAQITAIPSKTVDAPSIKESPIHMECALNKIIEIGSSPHSLIIGEVKMITVDDQVIVDGRIQMDRIEALGRMGGKFYTRTEMLFELPRLDWREKEFG